MQGAVSSVIGTFANSEFRNLLPIDRLPLDTGCGLWVHFFTCSISELKAWPTPVKSSIQPSIHPSIRPSIQQSIQPSIPAACSGPGASLVCWLVSMICLFVCRCPVCCHCLFAASFDATVGLLLPAVLSYLVCCFVSYHVLLVVSSSILLACLMPRLSPIARRWQARRSFVDRRPLLISRA